MDARYFVTYKSWDGTSVQNITQAFGRFRNVEVAEEQARLSFSRPGCEITHVRSETSFEASRYKVWRVVVRSLRILFAVVGALFAYAWLADSWHGIGDVPFASLTLDMIVSSLLHTGAAFVAAWLCWSLAFGKGPSI